MTMESFKDEDRRRAEAMVSSILKEKQTTEQIIAETITDIEQKNLPLEKIIREKIYEYDPRHPDQDLENLFKIALSENSWLKEELIEKLEETIAQLRDSMVNTEGVPEEKEQMGDALEKRREMVKFLKSIKPKISK